MKLEGSKSSSSASSGATSVYTAEAETALEERIAVLQEEITAVSAPEYFAIVEARMFLHFQVQRII